MSVELAIGSLYSEHRKWLQEWFRRRTACTHQAQDLVHEAFLKLISSGTAHIDNPRGLLTIVARQLLVDKHRRQALEDAYHAQLADSPMQVHPSAEQQALVRQILRLLDEVLEVLPEDVRAAFLLARLDGLGYADIAVVLGVSERTVSRYMVQAYEACLVARMKLDESL